MNNGKKLGNLDRMRAAANLAKPVAKLPPKESPAPMPQSALIQYACGHSLPANSFKNGACPTCVKKSRREKAARRIAAVQAQRTAKPPLFPSRLPDRSRFEAVYDAATEMWTGTLVVDDVVFTGTASGLQKALLSELDRKYREHLVNGRREHGALCMCIECIPTQKGK